MRERFQLSYFSSRFQVHDGGGIISNFLLYFFSLLEQHDVSRRVSSSYILYDDVLAATCSIDFGYPFDELWGKPYVSWCAPMTPYCDFMFSSYEMTMAENKWLVKHLLILILMQAKGALRWFHERDQDSLFGCQLTTCFYCIFLPCIADVFLFKGCLYEGEMRQQQRLLLLWFHLGEYGKNPPHTFHDIFEEKKGTFMVQGGS